jgi:hypothetical protein
MYKTMVISGVKKKERGEKEGEGEREKKREREGRKREGGRMSIKIPPSFRVRYTCHSHGNRRAYMKRQIRGPSRRSRPLLSLRLRTRRWSRRPRRYSHIWIQMAAGNCLLLSWKRA